MKELRALLGVITGSCLLLSIAGALIVFVGEWHARSKLPSEMKTPEAIQKYYDGAVCLDCAMGGGIILLMGIISGVGILLAWGSIEIANQYSIERKMKRQRIIGGAGRITKPCS